VCLGVGLCTYGQDGVERMLQLPARRDVKFLQFDTNEVHTWAPGRCRNEGTDICIHVRFGGCARAGASA
jgi:hypothetical protein